MAFKGVLPSDLWDKYDREDGFDRLLLDLSIAQEINDQIAEAHERAEKKDAKGAVARRNQRRADRKQHLSNSDDFFSIVEEHGVPVREIGGEDD